MRFGRTPLLLCVLALVLFLAAPVARAAELIIGLGSEVTTLDPHYHNLSPNSVVARHLFDSLTLPDEHKQPGPGLALRWTAVNDTTWEFALRHNVRFHDGTPFTAADAAASLWRALEVQDSPYPYSATLRTVTEVVAVNDHTLRLRTSVPDPTIPAAVGQIAVIPARLAAATRQDFDAGRALVGTGPFRYLGNRGLNEVTLAANEAYWGGRPPWDSLTLRVIPKAADRVAALTGGAVQLIDQVPPADVSRLHADSSIVVRYGLSTRLIYLSLDSGRERTPFVTDRDGKPLPRNPFKDLRVRKAISKAINRAGAVELVMEGLGSPASQFLPEGFFGTSPSLRPEPYDPEGAKRLLAEAGWPEGFTLTLHAPNNRYTNDAAMARWLGVALARIGITTKVETMPSTEFFTRATRLEFSAFMSGITTVLGETTDIMLSLVASFDADRNRGRINRARYANRALDAVLDRAAVTIDPKIREGLLRQASEMAVGDAAVLPLYFEGKVWAMRRELSFSPRADEYTLAAEVERVNPSTAP